MEFSITVCMLVAFLDKIQAVLFKFIYKYEFDLSLTLLFTGNLGSFRSQISNFPFVTSSESNAMFSFLL